MTRQARDQAEEKTLEAMKWNKLPEVCAELFLFKAKI